MVKLKNFRIRILILASLIIVLILIGSYYDNSKHHTKIGHIDKYDITSFKIRNIDGMEKEIKNKSDRDRLIDIINSIKVTKNDVELGAGDSFNITIKYSDGENFSANYLSNCMSYSTDNNKNVTSCNIDKDIVGELRTTYNKTQVDGIDNTERKIKDIVQINYNDITKIIFTGNYKKTVESKDSIAKIMSLVDAYNIKQEPQEFPVDGFNISAQFFIDSKKVLEINFVNPIQINGKSYEYINSQLGSKTINDYLSSISLQ